MPPKRKFTEPPVASPDSKKESKEERKKRIEAQRIRAKKWAEERKARAAVTKTSTAENEIEKPKISKRGRKSTASTSAKDGHRSPPSSVKQTSPKKKAVSATPGRKPRKERVDRQEGEDDVTEEEAVKPRVKRRKLTADSNEGGKVEKSKTPVVKKSTDETTEPTEHFMSPETVNNGKVSIPVMQTFMSPEAVASVKDLRSNIVYVPVNVAGLQSVNGKVTVPAPSETPKESLPLFSPEPKNVSYTTNHVTNVPEKKEESTEAVSRVNWRQSVEVQNEEEERTEEDATQKPYGKSSLLSTFMDNLVKCTALTLSLSMLLFLITSLIVPTKNDSHVSVAIESNDTSPMSTNKIPCFYNVGFGGENEEMDLPCKNPVDCPAYGRCEGGKLIDCLLEDIPWKGKSFYVPSESGDKCIPSSSASEAMGHLKDVLIGLSVDYVCRSNIGLGPVCRVPMENICANDAAITFDSNSVATVANLTSTEMDVLLRHLVENVDIVQHEKKDGDSIVHFVGLSQEYINTKLPIPTACYVRMLAWDFIRIFSASIYGAIKVLLFLLWSITVSNPIPTFVLGAVSYGIFWVYQKRSKVIALRKESSKIQNIAYDKLIMDCNEGEGYAALHLRDEIAHELYPEPCSARTRFNAVVWPRVVVLVRSDNRVTKTRKTIGGKSLEWWEWVADSSRKSRRSLAACNTIIANEGENATKKAKFE
jgi:hypothetical protein